jgi:hypothetical protein
VKAVGEDGNGPGRQTERDLRRGDNEVEDEDAIEDRRNGGSAVS